MSASGDRFHFLKTAPPIQKIIRCSRRRYRREWLARIDRTVAYARILHHELTDHDARAGQSQQGADRQTYFVSTSKLPRNCEPTFRLQGHGLVSFPRSAVVPRAMLWAGGRHTSGIRVTRARKR